MTINEQISQSFKDRSAAQLRLNQAQKDLANCQDKHHNLLKEIEDLFLETVNAELEAFPFDIPAEYKAKMKFVHSRVDISGGGIVLSVEAPETGKAVDGVRYSWKEVEFKIGEKYFTKKMMARPVEEEEL